MTYRWIAAAALAGALLSLPAVTAPADAQGLRGAGGGMARGGFGGGAMSAGRGGLGGSAGGLRAGGGGIGGAASRPGGFGGFGGGSGSISSPARSPGGLAGVRGPGLSGGHWHPGHHRHHHHGRWHGGRWPVYGYGLGLGLGLGYGYGAYPYDGYYDQAAYAEEQPASEDPAVAACAKRFRSYDPATRTYGGRGGKRIPYP